jgi:DNA-binding GntR family transcriptional regulator
MATIEPQVKTEFRPERYPAVKAIVDAELDPGQSLADMVGEKIFAQIIQGELPDGTKLKSTELAQRLGVSRTPVAKALAKLSADGILTQPNNYRALVVPGASHWLVHMHELRQTIEPEAAARAAGNIAPDVLENLRTLRDDAAPTDDYDWTVAAEFFDFALHLSIAQFCGNLPLAVSVRKCWSYKQLSYKLLHGSRSAQLEPEYHQHVAILQALVDGDAQAARREMTAHLESAWRSRYAGRVV